MLMHDVYGKECYTVPIYLLQYNNKVTKCTVLFSSSHTSAQLSQSSSVIAEASGGSAAMLLQLLLDRVGGARESSTFQLRLRRHLSRSEVKMTCHVL